MFREAFLSLRKKRREGKRRMKRIQVLKMPLATQQKELEMGLWLEVGEVQFVFHVELSEC
jgi:hypothetical protein